MLHRPLVRRSAATSIVAFLAVLACGEPTGPRRVGDARSLMLVGWNLNGFSRLFTVDPDGGDTVAIMRDVVRVGHAAWSPDRRRIAFVANDTAIVLADRDGGDRVQLYHDRQWRFGQLAWSPDGRAIAFDAYPPGPYGGDTMLGVVTVATGAMRELRRGGPAYALEPSWSPDGRRLMFSAVVGSNRQLHVMNADGSGARQLMNDSSYYWGGAQWSPDGSRVVYVSERAGPIELWIAAADGRNARRLTDATGTLDYSPSWSPDGRSIAFTRSVSVGGSEVMTVSPTGGAPRPVGYRDYLGYVSW